MTEPMKPSVTQARDYSPEEHAFLDSLGGYQKVFNAITDAVGLYAGGLGIEVSVKDFVQSVFPHIRPPASDTAGDALPYAERLEYEERVLTAEMVAMRLKRLVQEPSEPGGYIGDTYYPVGGTEASHRWTGEAWEWLPELEIRDAALSQPSPDEVAVKLLEAILAEARMANDVIKLNRDGGGQGRVKVATSMHRIEQFAREALALSQGEAGK